MLLLSIIYVHMKGVGCSLVALCSVKKIASIGFFNCGFSVGTRFPRVSTNSYRTCTGVRFCGFFASLVQERSLTQLPPHFIGSFLDPNPLWCD